MRSLKSPPAEVRRETAGISAGMLFRFGGRPLSVVKVYGSDPRAPVIVEELVAVGDGLPGQLSLWSVAGVWKAMREE